MNLSGGLTVQGRVIWALMLREVHTIYGNSHLGYLWVLINSSFGVAVFWALRSVMGFRPPHGLSTPAFLIMGFGIWNIFSGIVNKSVSSVGGNKSLLTFPQVTPLDLLLSRTLVLVATEILVAVIMLSASVVLGYSLGPMNWGGLMAALFIITVFSLGLGAVLSTLSLFIPLLVKLVPMVLRILFFCSGVFFSINAMPIQLRSILYWNPVLQIIEYSRSCLTGNYIVSGVDFPYLLYLTLLVLFLGLLLERYGRRYLAEVR